MEKVDIEKEKKEDREFNAVFNTQNKIRKEFEFLSTVNEKHFQSKFVRAQSKEICKYLYRVRFTPFKAWESKLKEMVEHIDDDFLYQFYIKKNEFGEYEPDNDRINKLVLKDPDPEEFPDSRR